MIGYGVPFVFVMLFIGAAICLGLAVLTWIRRSTLEAAPFIWMMLAIAEWSVTYALELNSSVLTTKILWTKLKYFGIVVLPVAWFALSISYNGYKSWLKPRIIFLLAIIPALSCLFVWTNDFHGLFWSGFHLRNGFLFKTLQVNYNWWFWVHAVYSYILILSGDVLFITAMVRLPKLRLTARTFLLGQFLPLLANTLYIINFKPFANFDLTPLAFSVTGFILTKHFIRFNLLEISPVARYTIVENMADLVIVVDLQNRIIDLNQAALSFISHSTTEILGGQFEKVLAAWPELVAKYQDENETEVVLIEDTAERYFDYRISRLYNRRGHLAGRLIILRDISERKRAEKLQSSLGQLQKAMEEMVQAMALIVEMKDPYTAGHQRRVAKLAQTIAAKMGISESELDAIYLAAIIHDIGKIYIPSEILTKPGRLTKEEFELIKTHSEVGYNILKTIDFPWPIARMVREHHERFDGSGYPLALAGTAISLEARIIAVADVVESMSNDRPYRPALGVAKALEEIVRNRGILYDPHVVDVCVELLTQETYNFELPLTS